MSKIDFQNGFALGLASGGVVQVVDTTEMDALGNLIDESGVLDSADGTTTEKVEQLIEKANKIDFSAYVTNASQLFNKATSFPTKAVVNLLNATNIYQAFSHWNSTTEPIPIVDELIVTAPNITVSNKQHCMGQMFYMNNGVKKVILNMPDESQYMESSFGYCGTLEEVVLNFSTKNIISYSGAFTNSQKLKKIVGALDFSSATNVNGFGQCNSLEEVTFEPNTLLLSISLANSSNLTSVSVQSIIDGLATVTTAQTLTLNKAIALTDVQKKTIQDKGWTLVQ